MNINAAVLERELLWFHQALDVRLKLHFGHETPHRDVLEINPPAVPETDCFYSRLLRHYEINPSERLVLLLALMPHVRPQLLDVFFTRNSSFDRLFTEFGGVPRDRPGHFLPTVETALFFLAGNDLERRFACTRLFRPDHFFQQHQILALDPGEDADAANQRHLKIAPEILDLLTTGEARKPDFGANFPARRITTALEWGELVLNHDTREQIHEIIAWLEHGQTLLDEWNLGRQLKPGYRSLFCGPPGTGKTLTACLLGKLAQRDVYRIDLSLVVSKYIGETEKNLERIFRQAEYKNWILFFDEADALFGKRTQIRDAHDRFANQEVSYLLQRVEDFHGVVILATNLRGNLDDAFTRRFQSIVHFPMPNRDETLQLWKNGFSRKSVLAPDVDLEQVSARFALSGGSIMNVIRYCSLMAVRAGGNVIRRRDLEDGIRKEFMKEGKTI